MTTAVEGDIVNESEVTPNLVQSVAKAMRILEVFDENYSALSSAEVGKIVGLNRTTSYRFCQTLEALGYLTREGDDAGRFRLGLRALLLGQAALNSLELPEVAKPHLNSLQSAVGATVNMAIRDRAEIVYLSRLGAEEMVRIRLFVGSRLPVHCTSMGKAILAYLPAHELDALLAELSFQSYTDKTIADSDGLRAELRKVKEAGYAINDGELSAGLLSVAAPVFDGDGYPIAAVNVATAGRRFSREQLKVDVAPQLIRTTADIGAALGMKR